MILVLNYSKLSIYRVETFPSKIILIQFIFSEKDSCKGDSGSPLMVIYKGSSNKYYYVVIGLVSFGPTPCGIEGWPGVYTDVRKFVSIIFIEKLFYNLENNFPVAVDFTKHC